jgi:amidase
MELAIVQLEELGAEIIPVRIPEFVMGSQREIYSSVRDFEFPVQINDYLATLSPDSPRTLAELVQRAGDPASGYDNPPKLRKLRDVLGKTDEADAKLYEVARNEGRALVRAGMEALFAGKNLDAIIYPTVPTPAGPIDEGPRTGPRVESALHIAAVAGFPDLVVPAGMTGDGLPVTISFLGLPFSEGRLLGFGYDFEQATQARTLPVHTPLLPGDIGITGATTAN